MKKNVCIVCLVGILLFSLTACKSKVERKDTKENNKIEIQDNEGQNKEDMQDGVLPDDVFDEDDYSGSQPNNEAITEEDIEKQLEDITDNYSDNSGPLILPEDVFE